jgi:hypothetical protein
MVVRIDVDGCRAAVLNERQAAACPSDRYERFADRRDRQEQAKK